MPREFPTSLEMLQQCVDLRSDIRTSEGRAGYRQVLEYIRDLAQKWSLGNVKMHEFDDQFTSENEPLAANLTIEIGSDDPVETGIFYAHGDVIHGENVYAADRNPYHLRKGASDGVYEGCGALDMKAGLIAELQALHGIEEKLKRARRRIIMLVTYGEEEDSSGINYARPIIRQADWAISTEISVNSTLGENGHLLHARPGRVRFDVDIEGLAQGHMGTLTSQTRKHLVKSRLIRASNVIDQLKIPCPYQYKNECRMPYQICYANEIGVYPPTSYSLTDRAWMHVEVSYNNPQLELPELEAILHNQLEKTLKRGFTIQPQRDRTQPWIKPWREKKTHPLVQAGAEELSRLIKREAFTRWGNPVAEEGVFADERVPIITLPPDGEGEHTAHERVFLPYIDKVMVPFLQNMATRKEALVLESQNAGVRGSKKNKHTHRS